MRAPNARFRRAAVFAAGPIAIVLAGAMTWQSSYAAFTAETRNAGNTWSSGTVYLTNDGAGSARFSGTNLLPNDTQTKCIKVTSTSSEIGHVKMYFLNAVPSTPAAVPAGLENYVKVSVTSGAGGDFSTCTGFVADSSPAQPIVNNQSLAFLGTTYNTYAAGRGDWLTTGNTGGEAKTYRIQWTFDTTGLTEAQTNALMGDSVGLDFEWEIQTA